MADNKFLNEKQFLECLETALEYYFHKTGDKYYQDALEALKHIEL